MRGEHRIPAGAEMGPPGLELVTCAPERLARQRATLALT